MGKTTVSLIVAWLQEQLHAAHARGFAIGMSGGLDSAICAALCKQATSDCLGLILPIESSVQDMDDAASISSLISLKTEYLDLTPIYRHLLQLLPKNDRLALGNIKARLRMVVLYYYANSNDYLVCGTGNKTELTLGYFTKYGDGGCDVLPLGDLYKHEVKELARVLNIPERIITKVPSAGLWAGQTDEAEIGFSYEEIEATLKEIARGRGQGACADKLQAMIAASDHKRRPPKICPVKK